MSQPDPIPNDRPSIHDELIEYIPTSRQHLQTGKAELVKLVEERKRVGLETYGTILQPFNGRDPYQDALEELADALVYVMQAGHETEDVVALGRINRVLDGTIALAQLLITTRDDRLDNER